MNPPLPKKILIRLKTNRSRYGQHNTELKRENKYFDDLNNTNYVCIINSSTINA